MKHDLPVKYVHGIPTFYGVYEDHKEEVMAYGGRSWNNKTIKQYDAIVMAHIIPFIKNHDMTHVGQLTPQDLEEAYSAFIRQGRNGTDKPYEAWGEDGTPEKVDYLMRAVVWTASNHLFCENYYGDHPNSRVRGGGRRTGQEQARTKKSLTIKQEILVAKYLMQSIDLLPPVAGLLLMFALGLRNNEACGVNFGYIREFTEYPGNHYMIIPQSTDLGANTLKILGKTVNSGRKVPMPKSLVRIFLDLKAKRMQEAVKSGYTGTTEDLPIAGKKHRPWERCSADDLSDAAKVMFQEIGVRDDQLIQMKQDLLEDAQAAKEEMEEDEFSQIESDPTAYLLRRNFATHIAVLGLRDVEIWYVIGHKIEDEYVQRRAFNDEKLLFAIKRKMDERPILNPILLEKRVRMENGNVIQLQGSKKISLEIPVCEPSTVRIQVTAKEPVDPINLNVKTKLISGEVKSTLLTYSTKLPEPPQRTIDGTRMYLEQYEKSDADEIV